MLGSCRALRLIALLLLLLIGSLAIAAFHLHKNSDALWQIVSEKCEPNQGATGSPAPCQRVALDEGYALLKDLNGPLQYLLIPLAKITGMESLTLLDCATPNFFAFAWQSRTQLEARPSPTAHCRWRSMPSMAAPESAAYPHLLPALAAAESGVGRGDTGSSLPDFAAIKKAARSRLFFYLALRLFRFRCGFNDHCEGISLQ